MVARTPPAFTSFTQRADAPGLAASGARLTSYTVQRVNPVRGALPAGVEVGRGLWRAEAAGHLPVPDAPFIGATTHAVYVDSATRGELGRISAAESGPVAVLIPIRKTAEWWALASEQRQAYVMAGAPNGHLAIGRRYAARIYRRLYQARYLPGSEWDFLTYFEFPAQETSAFTDLLAELRDLDVNPEWGFVDREVEIWMERLAGTASRGEPERGRAHPGDRASGCGVQPLTMRSRVFRSPASTAPCTRQRSLPSGSIRSCSGSSGSELSFSASSQAWRRAPSGSQ